MDDVLAALIAQALDRATVDVADIAQFEGYNPNTIRNTRYQWLLPGYGVSNKGRCREWTLLEYWEWRAIDADTRQESINALAPIPREEVLRQWKAALARTSGQALIKGLETQAQRKLLTIRELFRSLNQEVIST